MRRCLKKKKKLTTKIAVIVLLLLLLARRATLGSRLSNAIAAERRKLHQTMENFNNNMKKKTAKQAAKPLH